MLVRPGTLRTNDTRAGESRVAPSLFTMSNPKQSSFSDTTWPFELLSTKPKGNPHFGSNVHVDNCKDPGIRLKVGR